MKNTKVFFVLVLLFSSFAVHARTWEKIDIPGAACGDGQQYSVFLDRKDADKLLVEFMGGGACWSERTCYGKTALTNLAPITAPINSVVATEVANNPWNHHTALYFPYCTGDVHSGMHVGSYVPSVLIHHEGYSNVVLALQHLQQQNIVNFPGMNDVTVWGASAGAIGALVHSATLESYLSPFARKTLISDSPGLHFGKSFWQKFSAETNLDYQTNFAKMGLVYNLDNGFIAPLMGPVFQKLHLWSVGILQSTKDTVMSIVFGGITPDAHRQLVLGAYGIPQIAKPFPNVKVWIADVSTHTFLVKDKSAVTKSMQGETAWNFATRVYGPTARP